MYERFYGFREAPFELTSNPRFLFFTALMVLFFFFMGILQWRENRTK